MGFSGALFSVVHCKPSVSFFLPLLVYFQFLFQISDFVYFVLCWLCLLMFLIVELSVWFLQLLTFLAYSLLL